MLAVSHAHPIAHLHGSRWTQRIDLTTPHKLFWCEANSRITREITHAGEERQWTSPFDALRHIERAVRESNGTRCVGFLSYDLGAVFEDRVAANRLPDAPLFAFLLQSNDQNPPVQIRQPNDRQEGSIQRTFERDSYCAAVARVKDYISAGDVFQVNLAQRFSMPIQQEIAAIDEKLRQTAPADYGAMIQVGDFALISNSPELFLHVSSDRRVITRPIKGTRPRGPGMKDELIASVKDQAELAMIVDLERNDLGRVCETASVRVNQPREIETHPTLYHSVATIEGKLKRDVDFVDLLRATFPCGSITGAPKIRAMQIINELEPVPRGPYCGAIGYLSSDGAIEFNVAIRTIIVQNGIAHVSVGGGIVADSVPADEYAETLVKARAMFDALNVQLRE